MNDLTVSTPSAPAPLDPRFAPESLGVPSPAMTPAPFAHAIVPLLLAVQYANSAVDRLFYDTEQFWLRLRYFSLVSSGYSCSPNTGIGNSPAGPKTSISRI